MTSELSAKQILVVLGSLQARSSNGTLARALLSYLGGGVDITFTRALYDLPPFNADVEAGTPPAVVGAWRAEIAAADVVIFATPEYAFGIPGTLKNSLDWVVGTGEFVGKHVALLGVSTMGSGASFALEALDRTIRVMSAEVIGTLSVGHVRAKLDENGTVSDPETRDALARLASSVTASLAVSAGPVL
ncbi:MAG: NADPH-dependent FMN reductase [bacterium]